MKSLKRHHELLVGKRKPCDWPSVIRKFQSTLGTGWDIRLALIPFPEALFWECLQMTETCLHTKYSERKYTLPAMLVPVKAAFPSEQSQGSMCGEIRGTSSASQTLRGLAKWGEERPDRKPAAKAGISVNPVACDLWVTRAVGKASEHPSSFACLPRIPGFACVPPYPTTEVSAWKWCSGSSLLGDIWLLSCFCSLLLQRHMVPSSGIWKSVLPLDREPEIRPAALRDGTLRTRKGLLGATSPSSRLRPQVGSGAQCSVGRDGSGLEEPGLPQPWALCPSGCPSLHWLPCPKRKWTCGRNSELWARKGLSIAGLPSSPQNLTSVIPRNGRQTASPAQGTTRNSIWSHFGES